MRHHFLIAFPFLQWMNSVSIPQPRCFFGKRYLFDDLITPNRAEDICENFGEVSMKSLVVKRSVVIDGRKTSVSLEDAFWSDLKEIAHMQQITLSEVVTKIDRGRQAGNLSSAIRLFVLDQVRTHGDLWRYSRSRRSRKETAQIEVLPAQPNGRTSQVLSS